MFWFRPKALQHLLDQGWKYSDFPKEPIRTDGTILHAIERIYPFVVQNSGYYCGWVLNDDYARTEWQNLVFMLRKVNIQAMKTFGMSDHYGLTATMEYWYNKRTGGSNVGVPPTSLRLMLKQRLREKCPKPIWKIAKVFYRLFGGKKWLDETLC